MPAGVMKVLVKVLAELVVVMQVSANAARDRVMDIYSNSNFHNSLRPRRAARSSTGRTRHIHRVQSGRMITS